MMNEYVQNKILEIVKKAEDELIGSPYEKFFYEEALKILLRSKDWHKAQIEIDVCAQEKIYARRCDDAKVRVKKNLEATKKK